MQKRIAILLALLLALAPATMSCSKEEETKKTEATPAADTSTTTDTTDTAGETEADPYAGYDFGGATLSIFSSADSYDSTNANFLIAGSGEMNGEIVNDAVYSRNLKVEDGLNVKLAYTPGEWTYSDIGAGIDQLIMAGDRVYDVMINDMFRLVEASIKGQLHNVAKTDKLDLTASYWYTDAMDDLMVVPGAMYLMLGDYFADSLASAHVLYYNRDLIENNYDDADYLHNLIMDGKFTKDVMLSIMQDCAVDVNGDGKWDRTDVLGYIAPGAWGPMMPLVTGFDVEYIQRDESGEVSFDFNNEHSVKVLEACNALYHNDLTLQTMGDDEDIQAVTRDLIGAGNAVFAGYLRLSDFGNMREYETTIGLSPYPKLDESQASYISSLHDTSEVGSVLLTTPESELDFVYTCLEFLGRESSETVIPVWFDEALKVKYSSGEEDAQVLDIIRSTIDHPFALAYQSALNSYPLPACFLNMISANSNNFASNYQSTKSAGETALASVVDAFKANLAAGN